MVQAFPLNSGLQPTRPPAARLLYNLGLEWDLDCISVDDGTHTVITPTSDAPWAPCLPTSLNLKLEWKCPPYSLHAPLPLRISTEPVTIGARAARVKSPPMSKKDIAAAVVQDYPIGPEDMAMVYISADSFYGAFKEELDLRKYNLSSHVTTGLNFYVKDQRLYLASMEPSKPVARIPRWRTRLRGAWLIGINDTTISNLAEAESIFRHLSKTQARNCVLFFSHPEITPDILSKGLPIMSREDFSQLTHDQLNNCVDLLEEGLRVLWTRADDIIESGAVRQYVYSPTRRR
jgi:hypothetical protein